jgi:hypothetical protein
MKEDSGVAEGLIRTGKARRCCFPKARLIIVEAGLKRASNSDAAFLAAPCSENCGTATFCFVAALASAVETDTK